MRLKQIKLAGFKSFVDPTFIDVPSQLVGVVGPNGCGKSNVIDAVRWVLGESRASELRGESMQDVIFNGSDERRPAGRASVELVFDNRSGKVGGAWSRFAELSVRRVLTRDGQSTYQINNQAVRRRDVHDVFLGTGLGPRAYAIIGQGTVSRVVEARPDELRVFLEEAAGVSRYRERRRETEQRLSDARDNLARVDDVRRELDAQIHRLDRQAEVAVRFRALEAERAAAQHSLWLVRRDEAAAQADRLRCTADGVDVALQRHIEAQRQAGARLQALRTQHDAAAEAMHAAQAGFYESSGAVAQLEERIRSMAAAREQECRALEAARSAQDAAIGRLEAAAGGIEQAKRQAADAACHAQRLGGELARRAGTLPALETEAIEAGAALERARAEAADLAHAVELADTRRRSADAALAALAARRERLQAERTGLRAVPATQTDEAARRLDLARSEEQRLADAVGEAERAAGPLEARRAAAHQALRDAQSRAARHDARLAALTQIQQRLNEGREIAPWLARHGTRGAASLWQRIRVESGWETAVESILRERLGALAVDDAEQLVALAAQSPPARCAFFRPDASIDRTDEAAAQADRAPQGTGGVPLAALVQAADAGIEALVRRWLHGVFVAQTDEQGFAAAMRLPVGARIVTRAGHVLQPGSLQLYAADSERDGMLARQREIDELTAQARAQRPIHDDARRQAAQADAALAAHEADRRALRDAHAGAVRHGAAMQVEAGRLEQARRQAETGAVRIDRELSEIDAATDEQRRVAAEQLRGAAQCREKLAGLRAEIDALAQGSETARRHLAAGRDGLRALERDAQEASFAQRSAQVRIEQLEQEAQAARRDGEQAQQRRAQAQARLDALADAALRAAFGQALAERGERERALSEAREALGGLTGAVRQSEDDRLLAERAQVPLRERLQRLALELQAAQLAAQQHAQQLHEAGCDEAAVRAGWATAPEPGRLQADLARLTQAIGALGAVNLAALDELAQARERKAFLDAQAADLGEAVATLEDAIRRIDRETRGLLRSTFEAVDREFGRLFPQLFGGGQARLVLAGDEILDAGVTVTAQPPGKRNGTIALLSGGEKALTAIALVFAMFQLNPAPFCLLDEVDAPLDDANTERYANLVRAMSEQTQFLFITHNKIAMELAQHLVGVTMQERGVSRVVAVDLQAAGRLAEAA